MANRTLPRTPVLCDELRKLAAPRMAHEELQPTYRFSRGELHDLTDRFVVELSHGLERCATFPAHGQTEREPLKGVSPKFLKFYACVRTMPFRLNR
jgi:hypothetical protein